MEQTLLSPQRADIDYILLHHQFKFKSLYNAKQIAAAICLPALIIVLLAYSVGDDLEKRHLSVNTVLYFPIVFVYTRYAVQIWKARKFRVVLNSYDAAINKQLVADYLRSRNIANEAIGENALQINSRNIYMGQSSKEAVLFVFGNGKILLNRYWLQTTWIPLGRTQAQRKAYSELLKDISKLT